MTFSSDVIIVGAGPAGLSFARALADSQLSVAIVDPHTSDELATAPFDGREIALTHPSKQFLTALGIWQKLPTDEIYNLREAKVINGTSAYQLHFQLPLTNSKKQPIDTLGYLVSNHLIRQAAYECVQEQSNVRFFLGCEAVDFMSTPSTTRVTLKNHDVLQAPLLIAADSRFSKMRTQMGIPTDVRDFGRTVVVFRLEHEISSDHTAFECFFYGSTLALLPLSDYITNCVITVDTKRLHTLTQLSSQALADYVAEQVTYRFGKMRLISDIFDYPLVGVHAKRFHGQRCALLGDAACGMHPVTAHGFNLGLKSAEILSRLLLRQAGEGKDIGADAMLRAYTYQHKKNTIPLYLGTNFLVNLFTRETPPTKLLRHTILRLGNKLPPVKRLITQQLTG